MRTQKETDLEDEVEQKDAEIDALVNLVKGQDAEIERLEAVRLAALKVHDCNPYISKITGLDAALQEVSDE